MRIDAATAVGALVACIAAILALVHGIVARCTTRVRGRVQEWWGGAVARGLLLSNGVMTPTSKPTEAPRLPFVDRVALADQIIERLEAEELIDPSEVAQLREKPMTSSFKSGEERLAFEMLLTAIYDAAKPVDRRKSRRGRRAHRESARSWLMDNGAMFSARVCAETFGINYDAMREALRKRWASEVAEEGIDMGRRRHATSAGVRTTVRGRVHHEGSRK